jgi:hypothetical protein
MQEQQMAEADLSDQETKFAGDSVSESQAAAQETLFQVERNISASFDTFRDFNRQLIAMMRANAKAAFDLAHNLAIATSPADVFETWKNMPQRRAEAATMAAPQGVTTLISHLASQLEALTTQVATLEAKVAALEAVPLRVKASFGEIPHTGWTPSKVVVLGNDGNGGLMEIPSTIEEGGFRYTGIPSFWIAIG